MKKMNKTIMAAAICFIAICSCNFTINRGKNTANIPLEHEHNAKYICPMYCKGSGSDTTGTCPTCKMDYVKNKKTRKNEK